MIQPPRRSTAPSATHRRVVLLILTLVAAGMFLFAACSSKSSESTPTPSVTVTQTPSATAPTATATSTATQAPSSQPAAQAVMAVIERANEEQQRALAQHDPTIMRDSATADYYTLLEQTQQNMERGGVTSIKLLELEWGPVSVQGTTAQAATTETWRVVFADGSSQQSSDRNVYNLVEQGGVWLIASDAQLGSSGGQPASGAADQSRNWAGYAAVGGPFTTVSGTWTVPGVDATSAGANATWVGIGGMNSYDLIQAGTDATVDASGQVTYTAWLELLPQPSQTLSLTVEPGDVVSVAISQQATGTWQISIDNQTTGKRYETTVEYSSSLSSAEWIEEAPVITSARAHIVTLDDFGQVSFQDAIATLGGQQVTIAGAGGQPITMYDQAGTIASPSALGDDGASFAVTRVVGGQ